MYLHLSTTALPSILWVCSLLVNKHIWRKRKTQTSRALKILLLSFTLIQIAYAMNSNLIWDAAVSQNEATDK